MRIVTAVELPDSVVEQLSTDGVDLVVQPARSPDELADLLGREPDCDAVIAKHLPSAWDPSWQVRWVQLHWAGIDGTGPRHLVPADVTVTTTRGALSDAVAEFALAAIVCHFQRFAALVANHARRGWPPDLADRRDFWSKPLRGAQVTVLGYGTVGRRVAELTRAIGMEVTAVRRSRERDNEVAVPPARVRVVGGATRSELLDAVAGSDVLVVALPLTPMTTHLVDAELLGVLRSGALVVNVGRGRTVDQAALVDAVSTCSIGGAVVDVTDEEPLPEEHPLWDAPNCIVAPHVSALAAGYEDRLGAVIVDNVHRFLAGHPLRNAVDLAEGY